VTPLNIIYNSISRRVLTCRSFLQRVSDIAPDVFRAVVNPPCQRLELHYRTNRSLPKAANELVRIRRARRLESKTRVSLVNLGMICRRFEIVSTLPARCKTEKFHSTVFSPIRIRSCAQKSLYLSTPVCTYLRTSTHLLSSKAQAACLSL